MCGRYLITEESEQIQKIKSKIDMSNPLLQKLKFGEIFPSDFVPVIFSKSLYTISKWGFSFNGTGLIINAKSETILEKKMFLSHARFNRCLIPANGFYEWKKNKTTKEKLLFETSNNFFYFAGIYKHNPDSISTFVILTTAPNDTVKDVHDRMPVILDKEASRKWLSPITSIREFDEKLQPILKPFRENLSVKQAT